MDTTLTCLFYKGLEFLEPFIDYHLALGFSQIKLVNFDKSLDLCGYAEKYKEVTLHEAVEDSSGLVLEVNEVFHYQYSELISLEKFIAFMEENAYTSLASYKVRVQNPSKLGLKEFFSKFVVDLKTIEPASVGDDQSILDSTTIIFRFDDMHSSGNLENQREVLSCNEIINVFIKEGVRVNKTYESFVENEILDQISLKDAVAKYIPVLEEKNYNYQKFVIIGRQRSGTNLLCTLLHSHELIQCAAEVFNKRRIYSCNPDCEDDKTLLVFRECNPLYFLRRFLWHGDYEQETKAVGFKVLGQDLLRCEILKHVLFEEQDSKVIVMKRKNYLERMYSLKQAVLFGRWAISSEKEKVNSCIRLEPEACKKFFSGDDKFYENLENKLKAHGMKFIEVDYDVLAEDLTLGINKIVDFLGLESRRVETPLKKQNTKKLSEVITNYDELRSYFKDTKWEVFFEA